MTYLKMTAQSSTGKFGKANSTSGTKGKILYILENFIVQAEDKLNGWRHVAVYIPDTRSPSTRLTMESEAEEWEQIPKLNYRKIEETLKNRKTEESKT